MTKKNEEVMEKAIKDLELKLENSVALDKYKKTHEDMEYYKDELKISVLSRKKSEEKYQNEHSLVIHLDQELENVREQLKKSEENNKRYLEENKAFRSLVKLWV
jgi:hypothetical protein